ncbi:MAG: TonB-dependent receptor [Bacteroidota bacterium]
MRKFVLAFIFFITTAASIFAQEISGVLLDKQSSEPLIGATVSVKGTGNGTATDIDGKFQLKITEKPPFTLLFSYIGYTNQELTINTEEDLRRSFNLKLSTEETLLKDVEIVDSRITEKQKESPLTVESMGLSAIKQTASSTFYEGLGTLKGVDMTAASLGFVVINTRGFNSTRPVRSLQLLDGADNQAPGFNFSIGNFAGATEIDIQKVDLIVGASSPLYGPNAFNGVINLQTKNPFYYTGLTVFLKGAERNLFEAGLRYARAFKNKSGQDKFAFKFNFSYLRADDWQANNSDPSTNSPKGTDNPGGYDAVNRYGDELSNIYENDYDNSFSNRVNPGLKQYFRTGYLEKDLVNYDVRNLKTNAALHYKITDKIEARAAYNFGTGTTVYQGDNRYSLRGITFNHVRAEIIQPDKFYIRAYATMENGGRSYDGVFTAIKLNGLDKSNAAWNQAYQTAWTGRFVPKVRALPGFPGSGQGSGWFSNYDSTNAIANAILEQYKDSLVLWHSQARTIADTSTYLGLYKGRFQPGTEVFDSLVEDITARTAFEEGGTGFYDKSKMVHVQGEYKFEPKLKGREKPFMDILAGASLRMYLPDSRGTIFSDTLVRTYARDSVGDILKDNQGRVIVLDSVRKRITNWEVGAYLSLSKKFTFGMNEKHAIILTATCRVDKNQNFPFIATPAASVVYSYKQNHTFRVSFSSAIRNPTLQDQYLYYNVGRAILIGNLEGVDSLVTVPSYQNYVASSPYDETLLDWFNVPPVRPEKVKTLEAGYKGIISNKLYVDGSAYVSWYQDFLGYRIGADIQNLGGVYSIKQVYRVSANSPDVVMTYGAALGFSYFFVRNYSFSGNYSWNRLDKLGSSDPVIPAYNTPEHKFNVGISGKDIKIKTIKGFGFNVNYKYIHGFTFEGSPQFTGAIPTYSLLDAQISWECQKIYTTFKLGGSNLVSKMNYQTYGGPAVGRMIYGSILVNLDQEVFEQKLKKGYQSVKTVW